MSENFGLSVVIPHFYDSKQEWTPPITYNGITSFTFNHIVFSLNKVNDSSILLMSYRNFFNGNNGVDDISHTEIKTQTGNTKIIIAQEVGNVYPKYTTFYGTNKKKLFIQLNKIQNAYHNDKSYGGIAIHYFDTFSELP